MKKEVINKKLPFTPTCPNCQCVVAIKKDDVGGYHVKCENCNSDWASSPFSNISEEVQWLEKFDSERSAVEVVNREIINRKLPFDPVCPICKNLVEIEKDNVGCYMVKCNNCNNEWATSPFPNKYEEIKWIERFHNSDVLVPDPPTFPVPGPSDMKILMEIAHSSDTLKKAYDLVCQAHDLINEDKVARQYIKFNAKVVWHQFVWDILMKQYDKDNPDSKNTYHLRAFDYYGIQPGMLVGDGEVEGN